MAYKDLFGGIFGQRVPSDGLQYVVHEWSSDTIYLIQTNFSHKIMSTTKLRMTEYSAGGAYRAPICRKWSKNDLCGPKSSHGHDVMIPQTIRDDFIFCSQSSYG